MKSKIYKNSHKVYDSYWTNRKHEWQNRKMRATTERERERMLNIVATMQYKLIVLSIL